MSRSVWLPFLPLFLVFPAWAGGPSAPGFSGEAALGVLSTAGNTDTRSANGKLSLAHRQQLWFHEGKLTALSAQQADLTTDERYGLAYRANRDFSPSNYAFFSLGYDNDRFAGIAERSTQAIGYGRRLLARPRHALDVEIGAGTTQIRQAEPAGRESSAVALANARFTWEISGTSRLSQGLKVEHSRTATFINPLTELKLTIAGNLFATLGYELRHNSQVPTGTRNTDTLSSLNLGYGFGAK